MESLEINFWKVKVTEAEGYTDATAGGIEWKVLIERVTEEIKVKSEGILKRERMVLPNLKKCMIAGLPGNTVNRVISEREHAAEVGECRGNVEWLVVEDKFFEIDPELSFIFERGVWVSRDADGKEGRWVSVEKVTEEDEDEDVEDEIEGEYEEGDSDGNGAEEVVGGVAEGEEDGESAEDEVGGGDGSE